VSLVDLAPTVLELVGLPASGRGRSLAPLWRGAAEPRPAFVEGQNVRALRADGWAYLRRDDGRLRGADGRRRVVDEELYDLAADPEQHHDLVAARPEVLARMRVRFAAAAPVPPEVPAPVVHLRLAPDRRAHVVEGTLRSDGTLAVRALDHAEAAPQDAHALKLVLRDRGQVDLVVDPPTARVELALRKDGVPLAASQILVGPFALPLLDKRPCVLDGERLAWLDAARAPLPGERGDLLMWRDPSRAPPPAAARARGERDELDEMMRRWGYAQTAR
jgi:hypothetical protein